MATQLFANNATGALASGITNVATSLTLVSGQGAFFPTPSGGDWFLLTLTQATGPESSWEIVKCTGRSADTLTVVRGQEGTAGAAWSTAKAELRVTAGTLVPAVAAGQSGLLLGTDKTKLDATTGTNTGDETLATIKTKLSITTLSGSNTGDQTLPTTLPASDVYAWAKAATKPTYTCTEVGAQVAGTYATGTGTASGTNTGDNAANSLYSGLVTNATHSGDVTGSGALTIAAGAVTYAKMQNISATSRILGRITAAAGSTEELTGANVMTIIGAAATGANGYLTSTDWNTFNGKQAALGFTPYNSTNPSGFTSNVGTVTGVTGTAPVVSSGGTAPAISMAAATSVANGYMTSTYAAKLDGIAASANNYSHPANHAPSIITQDASNRFVTDTEKSTWNGKQAAGTYATGTGTASGTNTGDETLATIKTKLGITTLSGSNTGDQTLPTTLPASDVYAWAKAAAKPSYAQNEISSAALSATTGTFSGAITSTGNITAYYSDDRLKTRTGVIENALDKVDSLDTFYYHANELAASLSDEYDPAIQEVGLSAQQVQKIMPEVVCPAPVDPEYLTIRYERLMALAFAAIKELRAEVKQLRGEA
jgi:hypothetical protein